MALTHTEPRRIANDLGVLHAEPILEGTRIPVRTVVLLMRLCGNISAVGRELPSLTAQDIGAALVYYDTHPREIEDWIAFDSADDADPL